MVVQSQDIPYKTSRDIPYSLGSSFTNQSGAVVDLASTLQRTTSAHSPAKARLIFKDGLLSGPLPERMVERAKAKGLLVPLSHYKIYVYGASTLGLTPRSWGTIKRFWEMYFAAAGAELISYSEECNPE